MSRGRRYEEPKLNLKKVFAVILAFVVIIMSIFVIHGILSKDEKTGGITSKTYFPAYKDNKWGVIDENGETVIEPSYEEMIIVPINNTLLYVEPIYQTLLNESEVPLLKKVVVASGNKVAIGDTLTGALQNLLSQYAVDIEVENTEDIDGLIDAIIKANDNLTESNNGNDWELMGSDLNRLQELINSLKELKEEEDRKQEELENTTNNANNTNTIENVTIENNVVQ